MWELKSEVRQYFPLNIGDMFSPQKRGLEKIAGREFGFKVMGLMDIETMFNPSLAAAPHPPKNT